MNTNKELINRIIQDTYVVSPDADIDTLNNDLRDNNMTMSYINELSDEEIDNVLYKLRKTFVKSLMNDARNHFKNYKYE